MTLSGGKILNKWYGLSPFNTEKNEGMFLTIYPGFTEENCFLECSKVSSIGAGERNA